MSDKKDELLDSNYDGIQEYDNDLPRWWLYLFYSTVVFAILYVLYFHIGPGLSSEALLAEKMQALEEMRRTAQQKQNKAIQQDIGQVLMGKTQDLAVIAKGKEVFTGKCASCHGMNGEGVVGPNLADEFWIHGGAINEIYRTVVDGVLEKGMLSWKGMIPEDEIQAVTIYVWSLYGTKPTNPKEPQGNKYDRS